jgi:hypothetical protein
MAGTQSRTQFVLQFLEVRQFFAYVQELLLQAAAHGSAGLQSAMA